MNSNAKKIVAQPDCRGGAAPEIVGRTIGGAVGKMLSHLHDDQNMIYLAARLRAYAEQTDARISSLKEAVVMRDVEAIVGLSHALTDATARLGAIRMMKLCIAVQMLGRRGLVDKVGELVEELELEYSRFKETLIYAAG